MSLKIIQGLAFAICVAAATEGSPGDPDFYNTVAEIFSGPDCGEESFVWADPIFGSGGSCQPLDRHGNTPDILSYKPTDIYPDCIVTLYTDTECNSTPYSAEVNQCVQAGIPFVSAFVQCPFSINPESV
ncbi:hypothetical protein F4813DRAFT_106636 [Daldinia decipiens]|uniref:uncharacterized protein n=1 Tax=Daldinia decipiens TaxID=326647 RepID=UPI0020C2CB0B|nr:uncharacterized protein F4813DRAFT_106636 [Daldinia decipiens]KAI1662375.1 hypothetical protein F4813DRAFT_106636 [Daldinia decipiens]